MRDEVIKKVIKEVEVTDHFTIKCDCCNKEIFDKDHFEQGLYDKNIHGLYDKFKFYTVTTGHNDWGSDSIDSVQEFDLCSDECLRKKFEEFLKENKGSYTAYFKIHSQEIWVEMQERIYHISHNW